MTDLRKPVTMRLPPSLLERVDGARGKQNRTAWIEQAILNSLEDPRPPEIGTPAAVPSTPAKEVEPSAEKLSDEAEAWIAQQTAIFARSMTADRARSRAVAAWRNR
jgi:hypothetical protein